MTKWAQLTPQERAYRKVRQAERYHTGIRDVPISRKGDKMLQREHNRYYQLLGHWCKLKKSNDAQNSI